VERISTHATELFIVTVVRTSTLTRQNYSVTVVRISTHTPELFIVTVV
jgi:hypothetical protein